MDDMTWSVGRQHFGHDPPTGIPAEELVDTTQRRPPREGDEGIRPVVHRPSGTTATRPRGAGARRPGRTASAEPGGPSNAL